MHAFTRSCKTDAHLSYYYSYYLLGPCFHGLLHRGEYLYGDFYGYEKLANMMLRMLPHACFIETHRTILTSYYEIKHAMQLYSEINVGFAFADTISNYPFILTIREPLQGPSRTIRGY